MDKEDTGLNAEAEENTVPLGILLSEENPKTEISLALPTTAYWTGGEDSKWADPDA